MTDRNTDILILNTAVLDLRCPDLGSLDGLVGPGGLALCKTDDMPDYSQATIKGWIDEGRASAGGPGNTAPLLARAGLDVSVGANLGRGAFDGLDIQGRTFHDLLSTSGVDMSAMFMHPTLPTAVTLLLDAPDEERGGIAYFPNANDDFDFNTFKPHVERLHPHVVYYMYSGLSTRGDANQGRDLAAFIAWCRNRGCITIADSHTLTTDPEALIRTGTPVTEYRLLEPLLPEVDIFFTSWDEARMIQTTLDAPQPATTNAEQGIPRFLDWCTERFCNGGRPQLFGVTVKNGAFAAMPGGGSSTTTPRFFRSRFMCGDVVDLAGAGDSFRAGLIGYVARNTTALREGRLDLEQAIQMGNLMASLFIKAPLSNRYGNIRNYAALADVVRQPIAYDSFTDLMAVLDAIQEEEQQ